MGHDVMTRGEGGDAGKPRVLKEECGTCIYGPTHGHLRPGRLREITNEALRAGSYIVCHSTLPGTPGAATPAVCRGFYDRFSTNFIRIMLRLGGFVEIPVPTKETTS